MKLFASTEIPLLNKALDAYSLRQKVTAANLANISTVGYRAQTVKFEQELGSAMTQLTSPGALTNEKHIPLGDAAPGSGMQVVSQGESETEVNDPLASGLNNVDIDSEMAQLAKDQIRFKFSARMLSESFKALQKSIRGTV